jgi:hypothetical protein
MATAFHPWTIRRMPDFPRFGTDVQIFLDIEHHERPEEAHTLVELTNEEFRPGIARFDCTHDYVTKLKYPGRTRGMMFQEYVSPYKFPAYASSEGAGENPILWVSTKGPVAIDFVRRLNSLDNFLAIERMIDFDLLHPRLGMVKGAWFGEMRAANLSSTAVFGPRVDRSREFQRAAQHGRLRTLTTMHSHNGIDYLLTVTQNGTIVTYAAFGTEEQELDVVMSFRRDVLDECWAM